MCLCRAPSARKEERKVLEGAILLWVSMAEEGMPAPTARKEQVKERAKEFGEGGMLKNICSFYSF